MSASPDRTVGSSAAASVPATGKRSAWILGRWADLVLFVGTPLLILPFAVLLKSGSAGVSVETFSMIVTAFGALGHHLPGMIRAYGDRDLFQRFKGRFIFAPLFLLAVCIPMSQQHLNGMLLILLLWGCWHGVMQVYGFVRIYDAKVGSVSPRTAWWDWSLCFVWFFGGLIFSDGQTVRMLDFWYSCGGMLIAPEWVIALRRIWAALMAAVLIGFLINFLRERTRDPRPNPIKLLMLASGIGFWWFAVVAIHNIVLGVAIFEIFHDVQYLAIVWMFNRRRVETSSNIGSFMRFVFRRSPAMLFLYIGLVFAYGMISFVSSDMDDDALKRGLTGFIWASTLLHFYFDGFIWKVRDPATRQGLGLSAGQAATVRTPWMDGETLHLLKWSPFVLLVGWFSWNELMYSMLPANGVPLRVWPPETELQRQESIARIVPSDGNSQVRLAMMLDNFGRTAEAKSTLAAALERDPQLVRGHLVAGEIHHRLGEFEQAIQAYRAVIDHGRVDSELVPAHYRLGEIHLTQGRLEEAAGEFRAALKIAPDFEPARMALRRLPVSRGGE